MKKITCIIFGLILSFVNNSILAENLTADEINRAKKIKEQEDLLQAELYFGIAKPTPTKEDILREHEAKRDAYQRFGNLDEAVKPQYEEILPTDDYDEAYRKRHDNLKRMPIEQQNKIYREKLKAKRATQYRCEWEKDGETRWEFVDSKSECVINNVKRTFSW
ncbi:MAG: hypothetical protein DRQ51_09845 [Gammaproteobacteria bacterium]|nr:MAG: hypothetical protein DRQ51_09845 [Gammaproteobacteria bacterium]